MFYVQSMNIFNRTTKYISIIFPSNLSSQELFKTKKKE